MLSRHVKAGLVLVVALSPLSLAAQTGVVRGRVTEASSGAPLAAVQVRVEGTTLGALTSATGEYSINAVPAGSVTVVARRIGYAAERGTLSVSDGGTVTQDFTLRSAAATLSEVIVTGVGVATERRALGNTVETVAGEQIAESPGATAIDQALQGKVIGAVITENSGQPGGGVSIRLRGTNSILGGAEPLYVVDGVFVDNTAEALLSLGANSTRTGAALSNRIADLDPADVERVEVLKGAAAAALYGSRANNGVIQIFTKRGSSGKPRVTFSSEYSNGRTPKRYELNMAPTATIADTVINPTVLRLGQAVQRYDIQDQIFRTANSTTNRLSVAGGSGATSYFVSGSYDKEQGILRTSDYNRLSARANLSQQIGPRFDLAVRSNYVRSRAHFVPEGEQTQGVLTSVIFTPTVFNPAFDPNLGRFPYNPVLGTNPLDVLANWEAPEEVTRFVGGVEGSYRPIRDVTLRYLVGLDDYRQEAKYLQPPFSNAANFTGSIQNPVQFARLLNNDLTASHIWTVRPSLGLTTALGFRYTQDRKEIVRAAAGDLPPEQTLVGGATQTASQEETELRTMGWYIEERASFRERLFLTGGINWDESSAFSKDERLQMFPRIGASYLISEEPFWAGGIASAINSFRLRIAYGETGGQPPGLYSRFSNYTNLDAVIGGKPGLRPSTTAGSPDLKPERQREIEGGFDAGFWGDRAQFEFTYYDKKTKDLVLSVPQALSSGFLTQFQNIGTLTNKGVEIGLTTVNVDAPSLTWRTRITYAANRNRVEKLAASSDTILTGYLNYVMEGQPVGIFYGGVYARDATGAIANDANGIPLRGRDTLVINGVTSTPFANRIIGDPNPDWVGTLSNTFTFRRNIELSVLLDGRFGNDVANFTRRISEFFGADKVLEEEASGAKPARYYGRNPNGRISVYEEYIEDGSYVKLREIALSLSASPTLAGRLGAQGITLRLSGRNLYTWTNYRGLDPEVNLFSENTVARGVDFATTPLPRQFNVGIALNY
jgi:TonB-dependent starch-binding outer membrane protein SusC